VREYETVFIIQPEISQEGHRSLFEKLDKLLESHGAERLLCEDLGKRKLAYEIRKFQKGHYFAFRYLDGGSVVPELERSLRLEESVLRYLTVVISDHVADVEARKAEAADQERIQAQKAAERAAREAEEAKARQVAEESARLDESEDEDADADEDEMEDPLDEDAEVSDREEGDEA